MSSRHDRRRFLKHSLLASAGAAAAVSFEESNLAAYGADEDKVSGVSETRIQHATLDDLKGKIPVTKIGNLSLSRLILGGNLIGGWARAGPDLRFGFGQGLLHRGENLRDVTPRGRVRRQHALNQSRVCDIINKYWHSGGKIQFVSDCGGGDILTGIKTSIDRGAAACYVHGAIADRLAGEGKWDLMAKALELIRSNGVPAGIGGHRLETVSGSVDHGLKPDFWMKTLHRTDYWSFRHPERNGNKYCDDPDAVIAYMQTLEEPWIAFKSLAAGAIHPEGCFSLVLRERRRFPLRRDVRFSNRRGRQSRL